MLSICGFSFQVTKTDHVASHLECLLDTIEICRPFWIQKRTFCVKLIKARMLSSAIRTMCDDIELSSSKESDFSMGKDESNTKNQKLTARAKKTLTYMYLTSCSQSL